MRTVGGSLFASQLGQVVGDLSKEVVSGGDVGIPIMPDGVAAILPQNFADFGRDLEIPDDQLALYAAVRELAHARLFRHARWLRLHVISQVTDFARGVHVDTEALEDLASRFDPSEPEELRQRARERRAAAGSLGCAECGPHPSREPARDDRGLGGCRHRERRIAPPVGRSHRRGGATSSRSGRSGGACARIPRRPRAASSPHARGGGDVAGGDGCRRRRRA